MVVLVPVVSVIDAVAGAQLTLPPPNDFVVADDHVVASVAVKVVPLIDAEATPKLVPVPESFAMPGDGAVVLAAAVVVPAPCERACRGRQRGGRDERNQQLLHVPGVPGRAGMTRIGA